MKKTWKRTALALASCMAMGCTSFAATPAEIYQEAANHMITHPQGEYTLQVKAKMPLVGEGAYMATLDVQEQPFVGKAEAKADVKDADTPVYEGYIEQQGDKLVCYYEDLNAKQNKKSENKKWKKAEYAMDSAVPIIEQIAGDHKVLSGVKSVSEVGNGEYAVTYDMSRLYSEADLEKAKKEGIKDADIELAKKVLDAFQQIGDITVSMHIDEKSKRITALTIPLTPYIQSVVETLVTEREDTLKDSKDILLFVKMSEINIAVDWAELPTTNVVIPQDVRKAAK